MVRKKTTYKEAMKKKKTKILKMTPIDIKREGKYEVTFEDKGQDFLVWIIDEDGYVLDSQPFQKNIWVGKFTIPDFVQKGDLLPIWLDEETHIKYPIKKIKVLK